MAQEARVEAVQERLEFYFGDANLSKDKHLRRLISDSPGAWVSLDELCRFRRLAALGVADERALLHQAVRRSKLLELAPEGRHVRRTTPMPSTGDCDARTVYVEPLLPSDTVDSVRVLFESVGPVAYVSVPRQPRDPTVAPDTPRRNKGFAFVEFARAADVARAVSTLHRWGDRHRHTPPLTAVPRPAPTHRGPLRVMPKARWLALRAAYREAQRRARVARAAANEQQRRAEDAATAVAAATTDGGEQDGCFASRYPRGCLVRIDGGVLRTGMTRARLRALVREHVEPAFVDYTRHAARAFVRCRSCVDAVLLAHRMAPAARVVLPAEEAVYWQDAAVRRVQRRRAAHAAGSGSESEEIAALRSVSDGDGEGGDVVGGDGDGTARSHLLAAAAALRSPAAQRPVHPRTDIPRRQARKRPRTALFDAEGGREAKRARVTASQAADRRPPTGKQRMEHRQRSTDAATAARSSDRHRSGSASATFARRRQSDGQPVHKQAKASPRLSANGAVSANAPARSLTRAISETASPGVSDAARASTRGYGKTASVSATLFATSAAEQRVEKETNSAATRTQTRGRVARIGKGGTVTVSTKRATRTALLLKETRSTASKATRSTSSTASMTTRSTTININEDAPASVRRSGRIRKSPVKLTL